MRTDCIQIFSISPCCICNRKLREVFLFNKKRHEFIESKRNGYSWNQPLVLQSFLTISIEESLRVPNSARSLAVVFLMVVIFRRLSCIYILRRCTRRFRGKIWLCIFLQFVKGLKVLENILLLTYPKGVGSSLHSWRSSIWFKCHLA